MTILPEDEDYEDEYGFDSECSWCNGEGWFWGEDLPSFDPGWHIPDQQYPCPACAGTGDRSRQTLF